MVDLIDKVLEYLLWLQEPNESFGGMPVCPFVKGDFETNNIEYIMYKPTYNMKKLILLLLINLILELNDQN